MKTSTILLAAMLGLNAFLAAAVWRERQAGRLNLPAVDNSGRDASSTANPASGGAVTGAGAATTGRGVLLWSQLSDPDFDRMVERLRAAGFPSNEIRAIARAVVQARLNAAREAVLGGGYQKPYWRAISYGSDDPEQRAKLAAVDRESMALWRKLERLDRVADDEDLRAAAVQRFGNLPVEKLQRITDIEQDFTDAASDTFLADPRPQTAAEIAAQQKRYTELLQQKEAAIRAALTPEEFRQYELRGSQTALRLRSNLELFQPSEAEYQAVFDVYRALDSQYPGPDQWEARRAAEQQLKPQLEAALGPERYADFVQSQQGGNDRLTRLMARLELPLSTVGQVNAVRDDITQRAKAIQANAQLAPADRDQQLAALAQEANAKLTAKLGAKGLEAYRDLKGDWLHALEGGTR